MAELLEKVRRFLDGKGDVLVMTVPAFADLLWEEDYVFDEIARCQFVRIDTTDLRVIIAELRGELRYHVERDVFSAGESPIYETGILAEVRLALALCEQLCILHVPIEELALPRHIRLRVGISEPA